MMKELLANTQYNIIRINTIPYNNHINEVRTWLIEEEEEVEEDCKVWEWECGWRSLWGISLWGTSTIISWGATVSSLGRLIVTSSIGSLSTSLELIPEHGSVACFS